MQHFKFSKKLLRADEVADYFGVTIQTIYNWRSQDIIKGLKIGGTLFFTSDELSAVLEENIRKSRQEDM